MLTQDKGQEADNMHENIYHKSPLQKQQVL